MIASINSWHLAQDIPNAQLLIHPDAGHGAQFQDPDRVFPFASTKEAMAYVEAGRAKGKVVVSMRES
jgi:hypothetical protein